MGKYRYTKRMRPILLIIIMSLGMVPSLHIKPVQAAASELLSYKKPVLASSIEGDNAKEMAVDGNNSTRWASEGKMDPQWIYVDLGAEANINRVLLNWEYAYAKAYTVQVSNDAVTWTDIYSTTTGNGSIDDLTNLSGKGRYVRIYGTERATEYGYSLYEFEVYGTFTTPQPATPVNIAENKQANASTTEVPNWFSDPNILSPAKAFDGDNSTRWSSKSDHAQWISVDLGSVHTVGKVVLNWEDAYGKAYDIQVSKDGTNWKTVYRELNGQGGVETIKVKEEARYVKMDGFARGTEFSYSLYEFEVYDFVEGDTIPENSIPNKPVLETVNIGAGSYKKGDITSISPTNPKYKTSNLTGPLPSGGWWQSTLIKRLSDGIVGLPFRTQYTDQGLSVMNPGLGFVTSDGNTVSTAGAPDFYLMAKNINPFNMTAKVDGYGDYSVRNVLSDNSSPKMKTTMVKGSPYLFNEFTDPSSPYLVINDKITRFFDDNTQPILASDGASVTIDHIGIEVSNVDSGGNKQVRSYGIFAPAGTVFKRSGDKLMIEIGSGQNYLSIGTLPARNDLNYYYKHAYAFVSNTRANYSIEDTTGMVKTTYTSTIDQKRSGFSNDTLMALFPNQWKSITNATTLTSLTYSSIRGTMKVFEGNSFFIEDKFTGIIPQFGEPTDSSSYNRNDAIDYLKSTNQMLENNYMWNDPYWQGKNLHPLAQSVLIADQLGENEIRDKSLSILKKILSNWFTYSGQDEYPYYMYYTPEWGALHGDGGNHGMAKWLSDHHYLWGYYIYASAILASYDKEFLRDYGGMVEHLIRDMGNPSRTDAMYPYMRAFDPYEGVSWAGGYGDNYDGNNQEATSEALFAYAGEYLWGVVTDNKEFRDAGMWVYTLESNSVLQYWFDYDQDNWHEDYSRGVVGQLYGSKIHYGTYFASDANNIYGIQWLPTAPYMTYFGFNTDAAARTYREFKEDKSGAETGWYQIIWPFQAMSDPTGALAKWDPAKIANDDNNGKKEWPNTYWFLHAMEAFGKRTTDIWSSNWTTYQMFEKDGNYTVNIWNPTSIAKDVVFKDASGKIVGTVSVPAMKTVVADPMNGESPGSGGEVAAPVITPDTGTYTEAKTVTITNNTAGATIRYTTDDSTPTETEGTIYSGPFTISETTTIKAIAYKSGMSKSNVVNSVITINDSNRDSNIALNKTATASSNLGVNIASAALDGKVDTRWESASSDPQWITIDLGSTYDVTGVKLNWETAAGKDYKIQVSNGQNVWTDAFIKTGGTGGIETHTFNKAVTGRYVRMYGTARTTGYGYSIWEFEVYGSKVTQGSSHSIALNQTATASTNQGGNIASAAFDGKANTRWESVVSDPQWIAVDLGKNFNVTGVKLNWETAAAKEYKIQVSSDNNIWTDAISKTDGTGGMEKHIFSKSIIGRYVRMLGTARTTGYGYSLWEFEVYGIE